MFPSRSPEYQQAWRQANPEKMEAYSRKHMLRVKYNITPQEYEGLWDAQNGLCALCGKPESTKDRSGRVRKWLSVDHDHATGKVRGLLCHHCNAVLGHANDDIELLERMIKYLEENR